VYALARRSHEGEPRFLFGATACAEIGRVEHAKHPERFDEAALAASRACFHAPAWRDALKACTEAIGKTGAGPGVALEE